MNFQVMIDSLPRLLGGALLTLELVALAALAGFAMALVIALARLSRSPLLWMPAYGFIFFFRGTPLLVQIFLIYYGSAQFRAALQKRAKARDIDPRAQTGDFQVGHLHAGISQRRTGLAQYRVVAHQRQRILTRSRGQHSQPHRVIAAGGGDVNGLRRGGIEHGQKRQ